MKQIISKYASIKDINDTDTNKHVIRRILIDNIYSKVNEM